MTIGHKTVLSTYRKEEFFLIYFQSCKLSSCPGLDKFCTRLQVCMQRACKEVFACTKLGADKSIKTPLSSITMVFKVASCFCV